LIFTPFLAAMENLEAFGRKRQSVLFETQVRFTSNAKALKCTENSCQFED